MTEAPPAVPACLELRVGALLNQHVELLRQLLLQLLLSLQMTLRLLHRLAEAGGQLGACQSSTWVGGWAGRRASVHACEWAGGLAVEQHAHTTHRLGFFVRVTVVVNLVVLLLNFVPQQLQRLRDPSARQPFDGYLSVECAPKSASTSCKGNALSAPRGGRACDPLCWHAQHTWHSLNQCFHEALAM